MQTKLTIPIPAKKIEQAAELVETAKKAGAEMLELRVDYLENLSVELVERLIGEVKAGKNLLPFIVTCRDRRQGGAGDYPQSLRVDVAAAALKAGIAVDVLKLPTGNIMEMRHFKKIGSSIIKHAIRELITI